MRWLLVLVLVASCATNPKPKVAPIVENNLTFLYKNIPIEFGFCVYGKETKQGLRIERIDLPMIISASEDKVRMGECRGPDLLGYGHSHIKGYPCVMSEIDLTSFKSVPQQYDFLLCEGQLRWWRK